MVISHPLFHTREGLLNESQISANESLRSEFGSALAVEHVDVRAMEARPQVFIRRLSEAMEC